MQIVDSALGWSNFCIFSKFQQGSDKIRPSDFVEMFKFQTSKKTINVSKIPKLRKKKVEQIVFLALPQFQQTKGFHLGMNKKQKIFPVK